MIGMLKGFALTFKHLFGPGITSGYPQTMPELPERTRGTLAMVMAEDGSLKCRACQLCSRECVDHALIVEVEKPPEGTGRVLTSMTLDMGKCMLCGLCVEACPAGALTMVSAFEHATHDSGTLRHVLYAAETIVVAEPVAAETLLEPGTPAATADPEPDSPSASADLEAEPAS